MSFDELKSVSTIAMQQAIEKAISDLVGTRLVCNISHIDFENNFYGKMSISFLPPDLFDLEESEETDA